MWLLLEDNLAEKFNIDKKYTYLLQLNKINIIVGKNNSGKSYLMRQIMKSAIKVIDREEIKSIIFDDKNFENLEKIKIFNTIDEFKELNNKYIRMLNQIKKFDEAKKESGKVILGGSYAEKVYSFDNFNDLVSNSQELISYLNISDKNNSEEYSNKIIHDKNKIIGNIINEYKNKSFEKFDEVLDENVYKFGELLFEFGYIKIASTECHQECSKSGNECLSIPFKNYIPLLRNIRDPLKKPNQRLLEPTKNIFKTRIINEYEYNENEVDVITGLDFYLDYKKKLLGNKLERQSVNEFEKFLSTYFFEGKEISIIPDEKTYELKINIEDKEDRFIYEVGDGITSLIIIMYKMFIGDKAKNNIYFIEEPEQSFHPGFQRLFMNIISLNEKFKNCYFFFTTHSNHLIDISNHEFKNFRNYLCTKEHDEINVRVQSRLDILAMEELGVKPSSVQIANKVIWIEGKYDAFYIRLLLNKKNFGDNKRKYIEEYDYTFLPYGGSNGTLINFSIDNSIEDNKEFILKAKTINSNMLLIMDDDGISTGKSNSKKMQRYQELKDSLGNKLYKLKVREIENLFPPEVIINYFILGLKSNSEFDLKFLDSIIYDDYKNEKLGNYLNKLIKDNLGTDLKKITGRECGFEKSGFLYDKSKFYDCVLKWVMNENFNYDKDIPLETKELINTVEKFIQD